MSFGKRALSSSLAAGAVEILGSPEPADKVALSRALARAWREGRLAVGRAVAPARPARPLRPQLLPPRDMPKRRTFGSPAGRIALLHALAHIELNAIDLAWDIVARFSGADLPRAFYFDWVHLARITEYQTTLHHLHQCIESMIHACRDAQFRGLSRDVSVQRVKSDVSRVVLLRGCRRTEIDRGD